MRVVLINAPYLSVYGSIRVGKNFSFPLGLGYIAAFLKRDGHEVFLFEPEVHGMSLEGVKDYIRQKKPGLVGISSATSNFPGAMAIAEVVKDASREAVVAIGGSHASALPEHTLERNPQVDIVVIGEGELTMAEVCRAVEEKEPDLSSIKGIAYRGREGKPRRTKPRPFIEDLDQLPLPARELVDLKKYRPTVYYDLGKPFASMVTSRGCPFKCIFCASEVTMGPHYRPYSVSYVLKEIEELKGRYGIEHILFVDDTFNLEKQRVAELCQEMLKRRLKVVWHCFARVNNLQEPLLTLMKEAGCVGLLIGIESGDAGILKAIKKGTTLEEAREAVRACNKVGLKSIAGFMFGNPGESRETILKTIAFAQAIKPTIAVFNTLMPFPGTEVYERCYKEKYSEGGDWGTFAPKATYPICEVDGLSQRELQRLTYKAYRQFYLNPSQLLRMAKSITTYGELTSYVKGGLGVARQSLKWLLASMGLKKHVGTAY